MARGSGIALALLALGAGTLHADSDIVVAVSSQVAKAYVRHRLPNGTFQPETYVFGEGGIWQGRARDPDADKMTFLEVAHTIAVPLAGQKYYPGRDPKTTKLLIMVYWGTTNIPTPANQSAAYMNLQTANENLDMEMQQLGISQSQLNQHLQDPGVASALSQADAALGMVVAENNARDHRDAQIASLLGYNSWWDSTSSDPAAGPVLMAQHQLMINELEDERYFVVLLAYDWQALYRHKQHQILWETRFSIRSHGHDFSKELAAMAQNASGYFGQPSDGLVHKMPQGHVHLGELKTLPDEGTSPTPSGDSH